MLVGLSSSETLQIAHDPLPPRRRKRGSVGLPVVNEVAILSDSGELRPSDGCGEIVVRGPLVFRGYLDEPELTAASFAGPWFRTGDLGRIDDDGYVHVTGRIKEIINRGGEKISPAEIDLAIESLPGVLEAAAFGVPHPSLGEEIVAAVVREANATVDEARVMEHVRARAGARKAPRRVYFVEQLPRTCGGKLQRSALAEWLSPGQDITAPRSGVATPGPALRSPIEDELAKLWSSLLPDAAVGRDDDFFLLGGDSLIGIHLLGHVKERFGVELPIQSLFENGTSVAGMARVIEAMRATKDDGARQRGAGQAQAGDTVLRPRTGHGLLPLSHTQSRMWFMERLDEGSRAYNLASAHRLSGRVNVAALREGLLAIVERHEILRTTFALVDHEPRQIVHPAARLDFECLDAAPASAPDEEGALLELIELERQVAFSFDVAPLARFRLIRLADDEHVLLQVWHHIVVDGWSAEIFETELSREYAARVKGEAPVIAAPALQYADYALWQRAWLAGAEGERQLGFWREALEGLGTLELPTDRPRPSVQSYRGTRLVIPLRDELVARIAALSRVERTTPFMTLLAAFLVLLHRYSGAEDVAVGTQVAGRPRPELEGVLGAFLNTLVLRASLAGEPDFRQLLARIRERALGAYANQDLPFERLVEELAPSRDRSRNPLFQVAFVWQYPKAELRLEGLRVSRLEMPGHTARFDLMLMLRETGNGLEATWEYCTDLFEQATVERMARHFERLLEGIAADPERRIGLLPLLTGPERRQLLVEWNDTSVDYPRDRCIHEIFEDQCARAPAAVAVACEEERLTYRELNARANQLARYLIAQGVGPEVRVGLCVERSLELIVGLLGILKAGGAYVPLDPSYPKERLALMIEESRATALLTQQRLLAQLPPYTGRVLCIDRDWTSISQHATTNPKRRVTPWSLAYVIYTSGSTGTPKGVMIEHRSLLNYVLWLQREFPLAPDDRVLQITPISFDNSILELFWPLSAGAAQVLGPAGAHRSPHEVVDVVQHRRISVLQLVPTMLAATVDAPGFSELTSLRRVFTAGEALGSAIARRFRSRSNAELVNGYGPTETTVYSTFWRCGQDVEQPIVPIGRPLANTRLWILDAHGEPVPVGVPGEIHIGGDGVARGYLGRSDLTGERFVSNAFGRACARMYRTGDRARYLPDGRIEFIGRVDRQVKLRGFRIEPGEIEAILAQQPQVRSAAVLLRTDSPGGPKLVAYVAANDAPADLVERLRARLRASLPEHMVPAQFVVLEQLPLMPNGKVDLKALPAPQQRPEELGNAFVAPRNPLEELIAEVWCEVLEIERVGVDDNFFELGGHSLLAAQVVERLGRARVKLPLRRIFEAPTIAELAADIAAVPVANRNPSRSGVPSLERAKGPERLSPP